MKTFRELYCERRRIPIDRFEQELVRRSLHLQARPVYWLLGLRRSYTAPDYDFVRGIGNLRQWRQFHEEAVEYHYDPRNRGFLRAVLGLRVSVLRLQKILRQELPDLVN